MAEEPLSGRPLLAFPLGEFARTMPSLPVGDVEAERQALAAELSAALGVDLDVRFDDEMFFDGLGADTLCYLVDVWEWISRAADVVTLAAMGAALLRYTANFARRLSEAGVDPAAIDKAMPALGAPVMRLMGAHHAMQDDPQRAQRLQEWTVQPLFAALYRNPTAFHAQQLFLVSGIGDYDAFVGIFNACGMPREMMWVDVYSIRRAGS